MKKLILLFSIAIFLGIGTNEVKACGCSMNIPPVSEEIKKTDAVFVGKIVETIEEKRTWKVEVSSVLKGNLFEVIEVNASWVGTDCEVSYFKLGEKYLFFANISGKVFLPESCKWTGNIKSLSSEFIDKLNREILEKQKTNISEEKYQNILKSIEGFEDYINKVNKELLEEIKKGKKPKKLKAKL